MKYSKLSDEELVGNIKRSINSESSLQELVNRHSGIYLDMVHNYTPKYHATTLNEMIRDKEYQIYISALNFDPNKGAKFSTYLGNQTRWKCLNQYNKSKREPVVSIEDQSLDFFNSKIENNDESVSYNDVFNKIIEYALTHPDVRVGKIFQMRYVEGKRNNVMPWKKISENLKMSIQGCINIHNSTINNLKQKFNRE